MSVVQRLRRIGRATALAVAVVVAALVVATVVTVGAHRAAQSADARTQALAAARTRLPLLLTYRKDHLKADLATALAQTTGSFTGDYSKILTDVVEPTARRQGISTTAAVRAAGVVSGEGDRVVVLVFLTQTTTADGHRSSIAGSRVEVTLAHARDTWKIAGLRPV
jgi:Mce-associated membrane protein